MQFAICNLFLPLLFLVALCWFLFFHGLAERDLWSSHEGRAAQDAQTILTNAGWALPRLFDGRTELQKPPLYYWLVAATAWLRGGQVDAWAVRLPAALAGLGGVLGLYLLGLHRGRPLMGLMAATILATANHFTWLARSGRIDMPLTFTIGVALAGFYLSQRHRLANGRLAWWWLLLAYAMVALAVLLKGPIGAVLPSAVAAFYLLLEGELPAPWQLRRCLGLAHNLGLWWGVPLVLVLTVPCYAWADFRTHGDFFRSFFLYHNVARAFGGEEGLRAHPWWLYGPYLAVGLLPWTPALLAALYFYRRGGGRADPEARLGLVWLVSMVVVLSCLRFKRADYLLPAFPGAALFLGAAAERWHRTSRRPRRILAGFGLVLLCCVAAWGIFVDCILPHFEPMRDERLFAEAICRRLPPAQEILFFRTEAHPVAFHVGRPNHTFVEWEKLDEWAGRPDSSYVVMPPSAAAEWPLHLRSGRLETLLSNTDLAGRRHEHPLVLRTLGGLEKLLGNAGPAKGGHEHPLVLLRTVPIAR